MKFLLWEERNLYPTVRRFRLETLSEFDQFDDKPYAYYEVKPGNQKVRWRVSVNNVDYEGYVETICEAQERILSKLAERGIDLSSLPNYFISEVKGAMGDPRKRLVQRIKPWAPFPEETILVSFTKENVTFYSVESGTVVQAPREDGEEEGFVPFKYIKSYLEKSEAS